MKRLNNWFILEFYFSFVSIKLLFFFYLKAVFRKKGETWRELFDRAHANSNLALKWV